METGRESYLYPDTDDIALIQISGPQDEPATPHKRTGQNQSKFWVEATSPLILHFLSVLALTVFLSTYINDNHFNLQSRYALSKFTPLQSDITTAISSTIAIYRFFATMWSGAMLWRCTFILMGKGGISLQQISRLLTWQIHIHPRLKSSQGFGLLVSIILLAAFPSQLSGPILTGSITWSSSHQFTAGERYTSFVGRRPASFLDPAYTRDDSGVAMLAPGMASSAWQGSLEDQRTMRRTIRRISHFPLNSTMDNITLPYFAISKLEWIKDPTKELPQTVLLSLNNDSYWNPFNAGAQSIFALVPDTWDRVTIPPSYTGIISETRIVAGMFNYPACGPSPHFGPFPANIGSTRFDLRLDGCMIYGRVTYVAGAAECRDCRISSWATIQNDSALTVSPSNQTVYAIAMMGLVGSLMSTQNTSLPHTYNNLDGFITELLIRSYAATWNHLAQLSIDSGSSSTGVQVAIPTSRANIVWWRVWVWLLLNLLFTLSGILFLFVQSKSGQQLVGNPSVAALLLDTSDVLHKRDRAFCDFSTLTKDDEGLGYLHFTQNWAEGGHRQVEIMEEWHGETSSPLASKLTSTNSPPYLAPSLRSSLTSFQPATPLNIDDSDGPRSYLPSSTPPLQSDDSSQISAMMEDPAGPSRANTTT